MPNERIQKFVRGISLDGEIEFRLWSPPGKIVRFVGGLKLESSTYELRVGEKLEVYGYRYCPTHWEWVLLLRSSVGKEVAQELGQLLRSGTSVVSENESLYRTHPAYDIVVEENRWRSKGGSPQQVSVYLERPKDAELKFSWRPTPAQLRRQIMLAFGLYGWDGRTGLEAEIFSRL